MVYDANEKINKILGYSVELNEAETLHRTQHIFLQEYKEIYPKKSTEFIGRDEVQTVDEIDCRFISFKFLGIVVAGILAVCVIVVVCFKKRKRK